jgi:pimeloyl-ACP methyl ester carboxylesterase
MNAPNDVFKTIQGQDESMAAYDAAIEAWPISYESLNIPTRFGPTHLIACGPAAGPPLILLHGQEASTTMWRYNIQALGQEFRVYALDTIGDIGRSRPTRPPEDRADYAAWLMNVIDRLDISQVTLAGISYGGFLSVNFTIACPQRVKKTVLLAPGIPNFGPPTLWWAYYGFPMLVFPSRSTVKRFINGASVRGYSPEDPVQEQMITAVPHLRHPSFPRPIFTDAELGQISVPVLLLIGDHEIMYDPTKAISRACRLIPNLTAELVSNAGHFLNSDQPEIVNNLILQFLKGYISIE